MMTLALVNSGRSDLEISWPRNEDKPSVTLMSGAFSTAALPPSGAASKFVPRIVNTLIGSFALSVWMALPGTWKTNGQYYTSELAELKLINVQILKITSINCAHECVLRLNTDNIRNG